MNDDDDLAIFALVLMAEIVFLAFFVSVVLLTIRVLTLHEAWQKRRRRIRRARPNAGTIYRG